jgi:hypothetical protein
VGKRFDILLLVGCYLMLLLPAQGNMRYTNVPPHLDTLPPSTIQHHRWLGRMWEYRDSLRNKRYRDSIIHKITRQNVPEPKPNDSVIIKSEKYFTPFAGKVIRDIYFRKVNVFGPSTIRDTTFTTSMRLVQLANRLHYSTEEWMIRQSLFFRSNDTIDPTTMADNERYLRSRPYIQDARLYIINTGESPDSVDLLVVTKDVFEYGIDVAEVSPQAARTTIYNNNLFGAGQGLRIGAAWHNGYSPPWGSEIQYTKNNALGTFIDFSAGYTTLNDYHPIDTGVYEGAYYVSLNRPLYRNNADWVGGIALSKSFSINARNRPDSFYRDYHYQIIDVWGGYNFLKQDSRNPDSRRPNVAFLARQFDQFFSRRPTQTRFKDDPYYNNHRYYLGQIALFKQEFFKTDHFFGFGRTEDIPLGYSGALTSGWENWRGVSRGYVGGEAQKFWVTHSKGIINSQVGISTFFRNGRSEDAIVHANAEYYSRLFNFRWGKMRQFISAEYLGNLNHSLYRPLNINNEFGIWGYRGTLLNGYQRLNVQSETVYYSPLKLLGFKFNYFADIQASQLTTNSNNIFKNPIYTGFGLGCRIRNENLPINTLKIGAYYYPNPPSPVKPFFLEVTTIVDFRFDIFGLRAPAFLQFR